jgi:hypothetical protein
MGQDFVAPVYFTMVNITFTFRRGVIANKFLWMEFLKCIYYAEVLDSTWHTRTHTARRRNLVIKSSSILNRTIISYIFSVGIYNYQKFPNVLAVYMPSETSVRICRLIL